MRAVEQPEQRAKRQERDLNKIINLQRRRTLGRKALEAAKVRLKTTEKKMEAELSKHLGNVMYFDSQTVEIRNTNGNRLYLMRHVRTDAHDWTPSYWTFNGSYKNAGPVKLSVREIGGHVYGDENDEVYIAGTTEDGEYLGLWLGPSTVIERVEETNPGG